VYRLFHGDGNWIFTVIILRGRKVSVLLIPVLRNKQAPNAVRHRTVSDQFKYLSGQFFPLSDQIYTSSSKSNIWVGLAYCEHYKNTLHASSSIRVVAFFSSSVQSRGKKLAAWGGALQHLLILTDRHDAAVLDQIMTNHWLSVIMVGRKEQVTED
jgi:hypothetical protein